MRAIGKAGFAALARARGYMGGSRRAALRYLLGKGRIKPLGPDPTAAIAWADRVLEEFDPDNPEVPSP